MDIHKALLAEKLVYRLSRSAPDAEYRREQVRARPKVLNGAQKLNAVALFLQWIVGRGRALDDDLGRFQLERLLRLRGEHQLAACYERRADVLAGKLIVVCKLLALKDYLQALEAGAVV